jgi:hypothetical protein
MLSDQCKDSSHTVQTILQTTILLNIWLSRSLFYWLIGSPVIWTWQNLSLLSLNIQSHCGWLLLKCNCFRCQDHHWRFCFCRLLWLWSGCSSLNSCPQIEMRYLRRTHSTPLELLELRENQTMPHMTCSSCSSYFFTGNSSQGSLALFVLRIHIHVMCVLKLKYAWHGWIAIGHVNRMDSKRKVSQVLNSNFHGKWVRGQLNKQIVELYTDINRCKITNWKERSKNLTTWEKAIKEAKIHTRL